MSIENKCLYCAIDSTRTTIKIGVCEKPSERIYSLSNVNQKEMRMLYIVEFTNKHYESAEILDDVDNYAGIPFGQQKLRLKIQYFNSDMGKLAHKYERFFKKKFREHAIFKEEWFSYCGDRLVYIKRMFTAIARSENNALVRTRLYINDQSVNKHESQVFDLAL